MKRTTSLVLSLVLALSMLGGTAFAADETDTAVAYLVDNGIFVGDQNGNLNLDQSLTRAELAVILTRLDFMDTPGGLAEWDSWGEANFRNPDTRLNTFTDIPDWALPFIEYCYQRSLMVGVGDNRFDPQGKVNPKMACTVMLRYCAVPETDWGYQTSVEKAQSLGIAPSAGMADTILQRGIMAVIIYRGINYADTGIVKREPSEPDSPLQEPPTAEDPTAMTIDEMKVEIVRLTNEARINAGLPELEVLPELMDCAQAKADDFINSHYYGHNSPIYGTPAQMIKTFILNAQTAAENIAPWTKTAAEAFAGWVESPEHYEIILTERLTHIGVGIIEGVDGGYWWVQHFVKI